MHVVFGDAAPLQAFPRGLTAGFTQFLIPDSAVLNPIPFVTKTRIATRKSNAASMVEPLIVPLEGVGDSTSALNAAVVTR